MQAHSAKATTNNQQEQEPKQATKQQAKQRVEILRPAQSLCFLCIQHALVLRGCGLLLGGALRPPPTPPRTTKSALHLQHPRLPRNHIFR